MNKGNAIAKVWLTWVFTKALGLCGAGLAAVGLQAGPQSPELMAGVALTAGQMLLSWWNTRRALRTPTANAKMAPVIPLQGPTLAVMTAAVLALGLTACATTAGTSSATGTSPGGGTLALEASLPLVRTGASVATGAVLDFAVKQPATRTRLANEMYAAANAVYSLSGGTFPTPAQLQATVTSFGGSQKDAQYAQFASAVSSLYAVYYPRVATGDAKTASALLNALAGGIEDATQAYVTTPPAAIMAVNP